jgi:hypothetical protein
VTADTARLIAACLNAPKFHGRKACVELAQHGDPSALVALEADSEYRVILALRGLLSASVVTALKLPQMAERARKRGLRTIRAKIKDPLAQRQPGGALRRAALHAFSIACSQAAFRVATHAHETAVRFSPTDCGAESHNDSVWPSAVGLPNAYSKKGFRVTTSIHRFLVSPAIFKVPGDKRWDGKHLWLAPDVRVRQGRGTSLVCERKDGRRWVPHRLQIALAFPEADR